MERLINHSSGRDSRSQIINELHASARCLGETMDNNLLVDKINQCANLCLDTLCSSGKIFLIGNGGSAADAQHMAAEFISRFAFDRPAIPAVALTTDTSALTAIGNDYGYEYVFSRQLESLGHDSDILLAFSTSGSSPNIIKALEAAKRLCMNTILFTGNRLISQQTSSVADVVLNFPSSDTARIQEMHGVVIHILCGIVESSLYSPS